MPFIQTTWSWARIGHSEPQMAALGRLQPHIGSELKITEFRRLRRSQGLNCGFREWGGWGSNPRPADYESGILATVYDGFYLRERETDHRCRARWLPICHDHGRRATVRVPSFGL
jgi:hypothetical protein